MSKSKKRFLSQLLSKIIKEFNEEENMNEIHKNVIEPVVKKCIRELYPYMICGIVTISVLFLLIISILVLNIKICYK
tara:strand:+ start:1141 stop:1371 length:231 start_codon:yes stop_codon:yes gene_type:complete